MTKVTVFGSKGCGYCTQIKSFFDKAKVPYNYIDVTGNVDLMADVAAKSGSKGVPQTLIEKDHGEVVVVGFNKDKLRYLLGIDA